MRPKCHEVCRWRFGFECQLSPVEYTNKLIHFSEPLFPHQYNVDNPVGMV